MPDLRAEKALQRNHPLFDTYDHDRLVPIRSTLKWLLRNIGFRWLAKVSAVRGLENFPTTGAAILMMNHIAFVDPIIVLGSLPRYIVPFAKREVYKYPVLGIFPRLWQVIPVDRQGFDRTAVRKALAVLNAGEIVLIAPEGTRHPALQKVKEGIAYLAYKADVPIIPVAIGGTPGLPTLSRKRLAGSSAMIRLGKPFRLKRMQGRLSRDALRQMTDECMYVLARMLPEYRRGVYSNLEKVTQELIEY